MKNTHFENKKFENICKMSQAGLKKYLESALKETYNDVTSGDGFLFAKGTFPVLLLAHLDTVHKALPKTIVYDLEDGSIWSTNGIGGDDRCGVYMILEIIKKHNCSVLFCEDEEIGGVGAKKFIKTDLAQELEFNYAIEFDRRGSNDAVFYDCDNEDFEKFITEEFYKTADGSFSDISVVAPFLKCAAVNLSCGYYNAHTKDEYVVLSEMDNSIEAACKILEKTTAEDKFEYVEAKYAYSDYDWYKKYYSGYMNYGNSKSSGYNYNYNYSWKDDYEDDYEDEYTRYYLIEFCNENGKQDWFETYAISEAEAVGRLLMWHPTLCYNSIIDVCVDKGI